MQVEFFSSLISQGLEAAVNNGYQALNPTIDNFFNLFAICIQRADERAVITQGLEEPATVFTQCIYRTFYHLTTSDPTSSVLENMKSHYRKVFRHWLDITGLPFRHTTIMIEALTRRDWSPCTIWHGGDRPSNDEHLQFAWDAAKLAQAEYQREQAVPEWILGFAFDSLSLDPPPQASIVVDCLKVIAIDLGCDISNVIALDKRYMWLSLSVIHPLTKI